MTPTLGCGTLWELIPARSRGVTIRRSVDFALMTLPAHASSARSRLSIESGGASRRPFTAS